ncbi:hypothetical protein GF389_05415 [Candidatus Dojkabacteria bacterium]|nr:hypothetical protein [Candidatus Dojkabacteria bacterium]
MRKYLHLIKISFINTLDYRQELVTNFAISILIFAPMAIFWRAVFETQDEVKGFTFPEIIQYYIILNILLDIVDSQFAFKMIKDVLKGQISNLLLKPVQIKPWMFFYEIGQMLPLIIVKLIVFGVFFEVFIGEFPVDPLNLLFALLILPISFTINANIYFVMGSISFWVGEVKGLIYGLRRVIIFLSGGLVPVVFFPDFLREVLVYLPFRYTFQFPLEIFHDGVSEDQLIGFVIMLGWLIILAFASNRFFIYSYRKNESVGI